MAQVVVTLKIMPKSPDIDLAGLEIKAKEEIVKFCNSQELKVQIQPIAFGLKALIIYFVMEEKIGSTEALEQDIAKLDGVESVEVPDVRRAVG
ncbi:elongation factor 1-beta [Candidatus Woesearchaeota archaeon]|nr:elongation factor 1-beta [Candidatus Woesearchaeota archaeon]